MRLTLKKRVWWPQGKGCGCQVKHVPIASLALDRMVSTYLLSHVHVAVDGPARNQYLAGSMGYA